MNKPKWIILLVFILNISVLPIWYNYEIDQYSAFAGFSIEARHTLEKKVNKEFGFKNLEEWGVANFNDTTISLFIDIAPVNLSKRQLNFRILIHDFRTGHILFDSEKLKRISKLIEEDSLVQSWDLKFYYCISIDSLSRKRNYVEIN